MSDYVNNDMQLAPPLTPELDANLDLEFDPDSIDWAALNEVILQEPWTGDGDWMGDLDQGAQAPPAPGIGCRSHRASDPPQWETLDPTQENNSPRKRTYACDFQNCQSRPFKNRSDLGHHQLIHEATTWYSCTAQGCARKGKRSFYRPDKLKDHILAAHDNDTLFMCPNDSERHLCSKELSYTRDLISIHLRQYPPYGNHAHFECLNEYRDCPLPKCPFRIYVFRGARTLDPLQAHLLQKHDAKGRENFASRILERGYDAKTVEIVCPVCLEQTRFSDHAKFYSHFVEIHSPGLKPLAINTLTLPVLTRSWVDQDVFHRITIVPDEIHQCRRVILSLWPFFAYYPVWKDISSD